MAATAPDSYGPFQLANTLGLGQHQITRAVTDGMIPAPKNGRWSAEDVEALRSRVAQIREQVGELPDLGARRAAEFLAERFAMEIAAHAIVELARKQLLPVAGHYKDSPLYDGRALETFDDQDALVTAMIDGAMLTGDEAADYLRIRRVDIDHLVRAGWLEVYHWSRSSWQSRRSPPKVKLYRRGDLDVVAEHPAIDWNDVRSTPKGQPSPLAALSRGTADHQRGNG